VGINSLKVLRDGRVQIETGSKEEIEILTRDINDKCGDNWKSTYINCEIQG